MFTTRRNLRERLGMKMARARKSTEMNFQDARAKAGAYLDRSGRLAKRWAARVGKAERRALAAAKPKAERAWHVAQPKLHDARVAASHGLHQLQQRIRT